MVGGEKIDKWKKGGIVRGSKGLSRCLGILRGRGLNLVDQRSKSACDVGIRNLLEWAEMALLESVKIKKN